MSAVDRLKDRALALDAPGLEAALRDLDDDQRAQARAWVLAEKQFFATVRDQEPQITRSDDRAAWAVYGSGPWMRIMCLVAVCSPAEAARAVRWGEVWGHMQPIAREHARRLLADRPREWAQTFLTTTAGLRLSKRDANRGGGPLAWLVYGGLADHDLPCPEGRSFLEHSGGFSRHDPEATAHFRANRLNPDQVYLKIAAGFAADYDALPEAVGDLIGDGNLDRDELLETCLQSLTNQTRVGSQRVVAKILKALDLRPADIPGGLAFLTGVIATCDGSVGAALLPLTLQTAIETAGQAADGTTGLEELTRVIAGRKERGQKQVLLSWLRDPATVAAVGVAEARVALEVLGADQDDASLLRGIEAGLAELGAPDSATARQADVLGLWYLDLAPGPARERPWWMREERGFTLAFFLNRRHEEYTQATQYFVDEFVQSLAADHGVDQFVALCKGLRVDGSFALTRCIGLIESAFLAGGLRIMWPAAVDIADDVASAGRTPAGLPELLRLLTRYAPEVPDGSTLPLHLAQLAAAPGNTKSQLEARALGAALTRVAAADYTPGEIDETATVVRGLWELRPPGPVLGLLLDPYYPNHHCTNDDNLKYLLAIGSGLADRHHGPFNGPSLDANVVRELATAVQTSELEAVRARFARSPRLPGTDQGPTWRALELWLSGHLTPQTYDDVLAADRAQGPALDRVVFAWTCEQLARLATHPGLMSRPAMTDGTVLVPKLANQLRSFAGIATVGPLDLLLTLTRLRVTPEETDSALEALGEVPSVWTDPDVTRTATGVRSFDVLPVIRAWIGGGGMTETDVPIDLGQFTGSPSSTCAAPPATRTCCTACGPASNICPSTTSEPTAATFVSSCRRDACPPTRGAFSLPAPSMRARGNGRRR